MAATVGEGGVKGTGGKSVQSDKVVLLVGAIAGFFLVPQLARANPPVVNGFLLLVLFSALLIRREQWLPYLNQFSQAAR
jgi:hypothetical protein